MGCLASGISGATLSTFETGKGGWHLGAPVVGNIDKDPQLEIIIPSRNSDGVWMLDAFKYNGERLAGFPYNGGNSPINATPTLSDLDGDGRNEIVFTCGSKVVALRGDGSVLWESPVTFLNYIPDAGFEAVTNIFYLTSTPLPVSTLPPTAEFFSEVSPPIIADIEGDGKKEVLTAWKIDPDKLSSAQDYNPFLNDIFGLTEWGATGEVWSGGVIFHDAQTGAKRFIYHFHQLVEAGLALAQLDADRPAEVLVLNDADSVVAFDKTQPPGLFGKGMLHKKFGKNLRLLSGSYQTGVDVHAADLDGDGLDEVLVPSTQINPNWQPNETILDDDGAILWREWKQPVDIHHVFGWFNNAALIPVNPDHDNHIDVLGFTHSHEITFRYWNGVKLVTHPGWPKNFSPDLPTPPVVGDVDGDGEEDIIIGTYAPGNNPSSSRLYLFSLSGQEKLSIDVPGGLKHVPAIADVDGDGRNDVVYRALDGKVYVQNFGGGAATNVSWSTHRGNASHDGNFGRALFPAGTPIVASKSGGYRKASFSWRLTTQADSIQIFRSSQPDGEFTKVADLPGTARSFSDTGLALGSQYIYEVRAIYNGRVVRSAPFPILSWLNDNLVANGGFEEDDNSHWDKWFTGDIPWTGMTSSTNAPCAGSQSMEIRLQNHGSGSSITQSSHYGIPEDYLAVSPGTLYSFGGFIRSTGLSQSSEHWLEWDSSRTASDTNARPALPWPNYFTPSLKVGADATPWTYLNRVFEMPAGFSNVELRHRYSIANRGSGSVFLDNIFFRPLPSPANAAWQEWIPFRSRWKYSTVTPAANWSAADFDDNNWPEGQAKFGQGSGPQNIVTAVPKNQPAYYFRKRFTVPNGNFEELLLSATCTDDYAGKVYPLRIWLNGRELVTGGIEAVSGDGNVVKYYDLAPFLNLLRPGANTIAVMLNNTWQPTWDNVAFDIRLQAIGAVASTSASARIDEVRRGSDGNIALQISSDGASRWRVQWADPSDILNWQNLQLVEFPAAGILPVVDSGQNARPASAAVRARLYRLVRQ